MLLRTIYVREERNEFSGRWHTTGSADDAVALRHKFGRPVKGKSRNVKFTRVTPKVKKW